MLFANFEIDFNNNKWCFRLKIHSQWVYTKQAFFFSFLSPLNHLSFWGWRFLFCENDNDNQPNEDAFVNDKLWITLILHSNLLCCSFDNPYSVIKKYVVINEKERKLVKYNVTPY